MTLSERGRIAITLFAFAVLFLALTVASYRRESATVDEPQHLTTGYAMLKLGDYRIDSAHPPFLRMWAALPLLAGTKLDTNRPAWRTGNDWQFCHEFLFQDNDADRLLTRARFMIALLGVLLGILLFAWARELLGFRPAAVVLLLYTLEPNILAHAGLVTTDLGATCFMFGTVYFAWRLARSWNAGNLTGLTVFFTLAMLSKFSAILLIPVLVVLLWKVRRAPLILTGLLLVAYVALWGSYRFRYAPTPGGLTEAQFVMKDQPDSRVASWLQCVDDHRLLPNACVKGFTSMALMAHDRPAFLMGEHSERGWWYYFPVAFLIKTPVALLVLAAVGLIVCLAQGKPSVWIVLPPAFYFAVVMAGNLNIGLRHILPVYPFVILLAGWSVTKLRGFVLVGTAAVAVELALVYPDCLAFFNFAVGGPSRGIEYLADSNLDWGQGLKQLKPWMDAHHVEGINLCYFGNADPGYYGIRYHSMTGSSFVERVRLQPPKLPGYIAISATYLSGAYLSDAERAWLAPLRHRKPVAVLGHCLYIYQVDAKWW